MGNLIKGGNVIIGNFFSSDRELPLVTGPSDNPPQKSGVPSAEFSVREERAFGKRRAAFRSSANNEERRRSRGRSATRWQQVVNAKAVRAAGLLLSCDESTGVHLLRLNRRVEQFATDVSLGNTIDIRQTH